MGRPAWNAPPVSESKLDALYIKQLPHTLALETQNTDNPSGGLLQSWEK